MALSYTWLMISLFDLPISSYAVPQSDRSLAPTHIPPLEAVEAIEASINAFRDSIPPIFSVMQPISSPVSSDNTSGSGSGSGNGAQLDTESYDGPSDPWWVMLHFNLLTAEMLLWKEKAHHVNGTYEMAVRCARAMVELVARMRPENWAHVGEWG